MAEIAILAAIEIGLAITQYALTPKGGKQQPVDRGKQGDLRFTLAAEGEPYPYVFGRRVRVAGVMIDCGRTKELKTSSPGSAGGKKGQGGTPPTTNYSYTKTFAIAFAANEIKSFRQIKEDDTILLDLLPENAASNFYEGEDAANTFTAPTSVEAFESASNGFEITLQSPGTGAVQFNSVLSNVAGARELVIYYRNDTNTDIQLTVNGGSPATYTLANSSGSYATRAINITCIEGANTIKIKNAHTTHNLGIDRIYLFAGLPSADEFNPRATGVIADISYPADENEPQAFYDYAPFPTVDGVVTGQLATNGQAPFELYLGKSDQPQSSILMSLPGRDSTNTPAYEELVTANFQNYHLSEGRQTLGNITAELEPKLQYLDEILDFLYLLDGYAENEIDFSAGADIVVEGFVYDRREALTPFVASLGEAYGFDIVPIDDKCVLVKRDGASVFTIPEEECYGREEGEGLPKGPISTQHNPLIDVPGSVDVQYLDPSSTKEFHTGDARYTRQLGASSDPDTLVLPLVMEREDAIAIGKRYLWEKKQRAKPKAFATGPRYRHLTPGDVGTVVTETATHRIVLTSTQAAFSGLVKFQAVPQRGALYTQFGPANPAGTERPPVPHPANSFTILADVPALRDIDENLILTYVVMCGRGTGKWRGGRLFKERVADSDEYDPIVVSAHPATAGILAFDLDGVADPTADDTTNEVVIDLFFDESLFESRALGDIEGNFVNAIVIGSGLNAEIIQFADATYSSGTFPYMKRVTLDGHLLRGRRGTIEGALAGADAGTPVFLLTDAVSAFIENVDTLGTPRNFKGVTVGQAIDNAAEIEYACAGYSVRGPLPTGFDGIYDPVSGDLLNECDRNPAKLGSQRELYEFQAAVPGNGDFSSVRSATVRSNQLQQTMIWPSTIPTSLGDVGNNMNGRVIANGGIELVVVDGGDGSTTMPDFQAVAAITPKLDDGDVLVEFQIPDDRMLLGRISVSPLSEGFDGPHELFWSRNTVTAPLPLSGYEIVPSDGSGTPNDVIYEAVPGDRLGFLLRADGLPEFHLNYLGSTSRELWTSPVPALREPYRILVQGGLLPGTSLTDWLGMKQGIHEVNIVRPNPEWRYIADAQKADNSGSLPTSIKARVRQLSFIAGGQPSAWVEDEFTR